MIGHKYSMSRTNIALSTTADWLTVVAAAARALLVEEISFGANGTTSAANEVAVARATGGATGSAPVTPAPLHPSSPAQAFTNFTAWTTQPTLGAVLLRLPLNSNGGVYRWVAPPGGQIVVPAGGMLSLRSALGTVAVSGHVIVSEI